MAKGQTTIQKTGQKDKQRSRKQDKQRSRKHDKRTNNDLETTIQKTGQTMIQKTGQKGKPRSTKQYTETKDSATRTPLQTGVELGCPHKFSTYIYDSLVIFSSFYFSKMFNDCFACQLVGKVGDRETDNE